MKKLVGAIKGFFTLKDYYVLTVMFVLIGLVRQALGQILFGNQELNVFDVIVVLILTFAIWFFYKKSENAIIEE